ncbi:GNS1/SUR4 membrane protein family [Hibiscus syriacus]|uniref:GNS1/SUR4 membrane protein family n=1 Tax=Hibiscus syriacus TaxID=106335 RepID=A0A6A3ASQ2_HIBSY|nr:GNS1/SUR4 membrane protein family [Hibiscus syriacus]
MALKKTLVEKLFNISKISSQVVTNFRISSSTVQNRISQNAGKTKIDMAPDPGDRKGDSNGNGEFRRFLHKGYAVSPAITTLPMGKNLNERLKEIDMSKDRIRLDGLGSHIMAKSTVPKVASLLVQEAKKLLRVAQLQGVFPENSSVTGIFIDLTPVILYFPI